MKIAILDTETTGFDGQVIELAWIEVSLEFDSETRIPFLLFGNRPGSSFDFFFKPTIPITFGAKATHHILESDLINKPEVFSEEYQEKIDYLNSFDYVIGHNIDFDCKIAKIDKPKRIDTLAIARKLLDEVCDSKTQTALMYFFLGDQARKIVKEAHNALADVRMCKVIFNNLMEYYYTNYRPEEIKSSISSIDDLYAFSEWCRVPDKFSFGKYKGLTFREVYISDPGYITWMLTKSGMEIDKYTKTAIKRARDA